jgi:two-component system, NtrC family, nitrogen regulation response regulator GlnG
MAANDTTTFSTASVSDAACQPEASPALTILWHPDASRVGAMCSLADLKQGQSIDLSRLSPEFDCYTDAPQPLADPFLSRQPCLSFVRTQSGIRLVPLIPDSNVALDGKLIHGDVSLASSDLAGGRMLTIGRRSLLCLHLAAPPSAPTPDFGLLGNSDAIRAVRKAILSVADLDLAVLIRGATGTGKELTAAAIAKNSRRAKGPFVAINMAAIPASTAEAELFGHEKGAFTGATESRSGYFGQANGGTLFLDEIGLASPAVQSALLRTIETGQIWPLGARQGKRVDVRILAATDAQLEDRLGSGTFSEPLLYRLATKQIRLPSLCYRREDIGILFRHFLRTFLQETGESKRLEVPVEVKRPWLLADAVAAVALAPWPGNVRQLRNFAAQMVTANRGESHARLTPELQVALDDQKLSTTSTPTDSDEARRAASLSRESLLEALERSGFQPSRAARKLGISRTTLYERIRRDPELRKAADITDEELQRAHAESGGDLAKLSRRLQVSVRALQLRMRKLDLKD